MTEAKHLMTHDGTTHELVCCAPAGNEVLRIKCEDICTTHKIYRAIEAAYAAGLSAGRKEMVDAVTRTAKELNG